MHVAVNAAVSADGKLSSRRRDRIAISGEADFARVDRRRAAADAVAVGVGTVLSDDPSLTRFDEPHRADVHGPDAAPPARVVVDSRCRTPPGAAVLRGDPATYVLTSEAASAADRDALTAAGATLVTAGAERVDLTAAFEALAADGVDHVMVEGGGELIFSLFEAGLVDELSTYVGNLVIGGRDAPTLADGEGFIEEFPALSLDSVERVDDGVLLEWTVRDG
jgi:2,5-diamino-6-(ribosylamino)-4(3H)-pyrimidinone 5'-phosphate reductase